jgi:DNA-binding transcriptional regulator YiaG
MPKRVYTGEEMTGAEFRALRQELGLSVAELAPLLAIKEQSIRNMENSPKPVGRQTALLLRLLAYPQGRALIERYRGA